MVLLTAGIVFLFQVLTGVAVAHATRAVARQNTDLLAQVAIGSTTIKFDKTDILAITFAAFVFWTVGTGRIDTTEALSAFVVVVTGTGVKEIIQAWWPTQPS